MKFVQSYANTASSKKLFGNHVVENWIVDSGASHHMTKNLDFLFNVHKIPPWLVTLPDGKLVLQNSMEELNLGLNLFWKKSYTFNN